MLVASIVVSVLLAVLIGYAAVRKLTHLPEVVADYDRAGVPESWLNALAVLLLAAAAALVVGVWWPIVGIVAGAGLIGYFAVAVGFHLRAKDTANVATPTVLAALAVAAVTLRLLS